MAKKTDPKLTLDLGTKKIPILSELGLTGLKRYGGALDDEMLPELKGSKGIERLREFRDNDDIAGSVLFAIEHLARQVTWSVDGEDEAMAAFVREALFDDMSSTWPDLLAEILSMLWAGWSYFEVVYKRRLGPDPGEAKNGSGKTEPLPTSKFNDGKIGFRKIAGRAQETLFQWEFDDHGGIQGLWQQSPPTYLLTFIPIQKSLLFRSETHKGNPEGRSILRSAWRSYFFKKHIQVIEGIGVERDLAGYPMFKVTEKGPNLWEKNNAEAAAQLQTIKDTITGIRRDEQEGLVLPWWLEFELVSTGSRRQFDTSAIISRYDQRIAMTVMGQFLLLGSEQVGSFALASSQTSLFAIALGSFLDAIKAIFNRFAIPALLKANGMDLEVAPELSHGDIESVDLVELGDYITKLAGTGMPLFPNPELEKFLLDRAKLPTELHAELSSKAQAVAARAQATRDRQATTPTMLAVAKHRSV